MHGTNPGQMMLSEFSVTIPSWLTLVIAAACILLSIQMFRWYLEAVEQEPPWYSSGLPYIALEDENRESDD